MGDSLVTVICIALAAVLLFIFPLVTMADRIDTATQTEVNTLTTNLVDEVRSTGKLTSERYYKYVQQLTATGNTYDVNMEIKILDENPGKKTTQTEKDKIGENVYYSIYTTQIEDILNDPEKGVYTFKEGDIFLVTVRNTNLTLTQQLTNFMYKVIGNDTYTIASTSSGLINGNGNSTAITTGDEQEVDKDRITYILREVGTGRVLATSDDGDNRNQWNIADGWTNKDIEAEFSAADTYELNLNYFWRTSRVPVNYESYNQLDGNIGIYTSNEYANRQQTIQAYWKSSGLEKYSDIKEINLKIETVKPTIGGVTFKYDDGNIAPHGKGDINDDGVVNQDDFDLVFYHTSGRTELTDEGQLERADINSDGIVNIIDTMTLLHYVSGRTNVGNTITFTFSGIADTGGSGLSKYYYTFLDKGAEVPNPENADGWTNLSFDNNDGTVQNNSKEVKVKTDSTNNNKVCYFWVKDNAGNISNPITADVTGLVPPITGVSIDDILVKKDDNVTIAPEFTGGNQYSAIEYTSSNPDIAEIDISTGKLNIKQPGVITITCTVTNYDGSQVKTEAEITIVDVQFNPNGGNYLLPDSGNANIITTVEVNGVTNATYTWSTSNSMTPENDDFNKLDSNGKISMTTNKVSSNFAWVKIEKYGQTIYFTSNDFSVKDDKIRIIPDNTETWTNKDIGFTIVYPDGTLEQTRKAAYGENVTKANEASISATAPTTELTVSANGYVFATARDAGGNQLTATYQVTSIDKLQPDVIVDPPSTTTTETRKITITVEEPEATTAYAKSGLSSNNSYQYYISSSANQLTGGEWTNYTSGKEFNVNVETGTYYLFVKRVSDNAGNISTATGGTNSTIDSTTYHRFGPYIYDLIPPTCTVTADKTSPTNSSSITYTFTFSEDVIGFTADDISVTHGTKGTLIGGGKVYTMLITNNGSGTQKVSVPENKCTDLAGNGNEKSNEVSILIDRTLPTVTIEPNGGTYNMPSEGNAKISAKLSAKDEGGSELNILQYAWSKSNVSEPTNWTNFTNNRTITKNDIATPGTWYLWTKVTDKAGNRAESIKISNAFTVLETSEITITPNTLNWTNQNVIGTVTYGETLTQNRKAGYGSTLTEAKNLASSSTAEKVTATANGYFYAEATDSAGNMVSNSFQITNIDKKEPIAFTTTITGVYTQYFTINITGATDAAATTTAPLYGASGLETTAYRYSINGGNTYTAWTSSKTRQFTQSDGIQPSTTYNIRVQVRDKAGNIRTQSATVRTLDAVAQIKTTYYASVQDAFNAARGTSSAYEEVILLVNGRDESVTLANGKYVRFNLNNKTFGSSTDTAIRNNGYLSIYNGTISTLWGAIHNNNNCIIEGGIYSTTWGGTTIYNTGNFEIRTGNFSTAQGIAIDNYSRLTVSNANVTSTNGDGIYGRANTTTNIYNTTVKSNTWCGVAVIQNATVNINGGQIQGYTSGVGALVGNENAKINITGATIIGDTYDGVSAWGNYVTTNITDCFVIAKNMAYYTYGNSDGSGNPTSVGNICYVYGSTTLWGGLCAVQLDGAFNAFYYKPTVSFVGQILIPGYYCAAYAF